MTSKPSRAALRRSGGVIAVGAVVAAMGVPLATSASAALSGLSITPATGATAQPTACKAFTVTTTGAASQPVTITLTEPANATATPPTAAGMPTFCVPTGPDGTRRTGDAAAPATTGGAGLTTGASPQTFSTNSNGSAIFGVTSTTAGVVTISGTSTSGNTTANATASLTVTAAPASAANAVKTLSAFPKSETETVGSNAATFEVTALDTNGSPATGATVSYQVTSGPDTPTTAPTTATNCTGTTNSTGQVSCNTTITPANTAGGTDTVTFFVNQTTTTGTTTPGPDASEPKTTATIKFVAAGTSTDTITVSAPNGRVGARETVTATVRDNTGAPVSSASNTTNNSGDVDFQVTGADDVTGFGTTNTEGQATFTFTPGNDGTEQITASTDSPNGTTAGGTATASTSAKIAGRSSSTSVATPSLHAPSHHSKGVVEFTGSGTPGNSIQLKYKNASGTYVNHGSTTIHTDGKYRLFENISTTHTWIARANSSKNSNTVHVTIS